MLKIARIKHTPDEFRSSEWIAHNAAMEAKRPLLGSGQNRPVIGSRFRGHVRPSPAFYAPAKRERIGWRQVLEVAKGVLMLIGAVVVLGAMYHIGAAVF